jgi:hypothetical protein
VGRISYRLRGDPVVGWRYWRLGAGPLGHLRSLSQRGFVWVPGQVMVARCAEVARGGDHSASSDGHEAPEPNCGCGIHAGDGLASLQAQALCLRPVPLVVGEVALWGRVVTEERPDRGHDHRGQFAFPVRLSVVAETLVGSSPTEAVERLRVYGVAVGTMTLEEAVGPASRTIMGHLAMSAATSSSASPPPPPREQGQAVP